MELSQRVRKYLALACAAGLVTAFVLYRAGVGSDSMSGSKSTFMFTPGSIKPEVPADRPIPVAPPPHAAPGD